MDEDRRNFLTNSSIKALHEAQLAFAGEAERVGLKTEEDVNAVVKESRRERAGETV